MIRHIRGPSRGGNTRDSRLSLSPWSPFLVCAEYLTHLFAPPETLRQELDLPPTKHLPPQGCILQKIPRLYLEAQNERKLVDAARAFDAVEKSLMENRNRLLAGADPRTKRNVPQTVHDMGKIDVIGTPDAAGMAGSAYPYALTTQHLLSLPVLDLTDHLIGENIHRRDNGTSRRTLLALVTGPDVHRALTDDFIKKWILKILCRYVHIHLLPHLIIWIVVCMATLPETKGETVPVIVLPAGRNARFIAYCRTPYNKDDALVKAKLEQFKYG